MHSTTASLIFSMKSGDTINNEVHFSFVLHTINPFDLHTLRHHNYVFFIIKQIIALSASENKLKNVQEQAEEYARLIMEELDPNGLGYIEVNFIVSRIT